MCSGSASAVEPGMFLYVITLAVPAEDPELRCECGGSGGSTILADDGCDEEPEEDEEEEDADDDGGDW